MTTAIHKTIKYIANDLATCAGISADPARVYDALRERVREHFACHNWEVDLANEVADTVSRRLANELLWADVWEYMDVADVVANAMKETAA